MSDKQPKYRIIRSAQPEELDKQVNEVHMLGYKAIGISFVPGSGVVVLMEFGGPGVV